MVPNGVRHLEGHRGPVYALGSWQGGVLSGSGDGTVALWDLDTGAAVALARVDQAVFALAVTTPGDALLIGTEGGGLHVIDLVRRCETQHLSSHRRGIFRIVALADDRVACAGGDGTLSVWRSRSDPQGPKLDLLRQLPLAEGKLRDVAASTDGRFVAVASGDGPVHVLDGRDLNEHLTLAGHEGGSTSLAWHPTKPVLLSGGKDGHLRAWHAADGRPLLAQAAHRGGIYALAFHPGGRTLASASRDKTAKLWTADGLEPMARLDRTAGGHTHSVNALCWMDGRLITAGDDRRVIAWAVPPTTVGHG
ncbi:MAG: hypothetical protein GFGODING_01875 [Flavobacteriales bacterium]|nr:hypothetical protein [Flavobacteriales bacterium]